MCSPPFFLAGGSGSSCFLTPKSLYPKEDGNSFSRFARQRRVKPRDGQTDWHAGTSVAIVCLKWTSAWHKSTLLKRGTRERLLLLLAEGRNTRRSIHALDIQLCRKAWNPVSDTRADISARWLDSRWPATPRFLNLRRHNSVVPGLRPAPTTCVVRGVLHALDVQRRRAAWTAVNPAAVILVLL